MISNTFMVVKTTHDGRTFLGKIEVLGKTPKQMEPPIEAFQKINGTTRKFIFSKIKNNVVYYKEPDFD